MRSRRSSRRSSDARAGFSLLELLISVGLAGTLLVGVVKFFATQVRTARTHGFRIEAQQAMRGSLDAITRDLRLAGACLPGDGAFTSLTGTDGPGTDSVTIRSGLVRTNNQCLRTVTTAAVAGGATVITVESGADFTADMLAYVKHPNGSGEFGFLTAASATTVTFDTGMTQPYPAGSSIHGVDERTYEVDSTDDPPLLMLTINRGEPQAFAAGMSDLQFTYVLDRNCPTCDVVDLPTTTAEWWLVNAVEVTATVDTIGTTQPDEMATIVASSVGKPRNLLP
jgi:type II secretory pathway pseudopilin PulG